MAELLYFADPMCSWCYGYSSVINALEEKHSVQLVMGGLRGAETPPMTTELRKTIQHHWEKVQTTTESDGQPVAFDFDRGIPLGFVYNTEPACRAVVVMQQLNPALALPYMADVQQRFYAKAEDVTQVELLASIAADHGVSESEFLAHLEADEAKAATRDHFVTTQQCGVSGFPALMLKRDGEWHPVSMGYSSLAVVELKIQALLS